MTVTFVLAVRVLLGRSVTLKGCSSIGGRRAVFLAGLMTLTCTNLFNTAMVRVSTPSIKAEYGIGVSELAWVGTGFFLPYVVLMPAVGRLADLHGRKKVLLAGLILFLVGTVACSSSPTYFGLVLGRMLQGVGAAGINPLSMATMLAVFPAESLGAAMGLWQSSGPFAETIGFAGGGWLIEMSGWRMTFWVTLALGVLAALLVRSWVPESGGAESSPGFDWPGTAMLALGLGLLLLATTSSAQEGLTSGRTLFLVGLGLAFLGVFWLLETKIVPKGVRLLNVRLLVDRSFALASCLAALRMFVVGASYFMLPLFLEEVWGVGPMTVGLILGLAPLMVGVGSVVGGRLTDIYGPRALNIIGMAILTVAFVLLSGIASVGSLMHLVLAVLLQGFGAGLSLVPLHHVAGSRFGEQEAGVGFGTYNAIRFLGSACSPALTGTVLAIALSRYAGVPSGQAYAYSVAYLLVAALTVLATGGSFLFER
jgi:EmrB/QacA subfamily drug resistance transporter